MSKIHATISIDSFDFEVIKEKKACSKCYGMWSNFRFVAIFTTTRTIPQILFMAFFQLVTYIKRSDLNTNVRKVWDCLSVF